MYVSLFSPPPSSTVSCIFYFIFFAPLPPPEPALSRPCWAGVQATAPLSAPAGPQSAQLDSGSGSGSGSGAAAGSGVSVWWQTPPALFKGASVSEGPTSHFVSASFYLFIDLFLLFSSVASSSVLSTHLCSHLSSLLLCRPPPPAAPTIFSNTLKLILCLFCFQKRIKYCPPKKHEQKMALYI